MLKTSRFESTHDLYAHRPRRKKTHVKEGILYCLGQASRQVLAMPKKSSLQTKRSYQHGWLYAHMGKTHHSRVAAAAVHDKLLGCSGLVEMPGDHFGRVSKLRIESPLV